MKRPPASPLRRILFIEELSGLIGKKETTIRTYVSNIRYLNRHLIPQPFKLPNSRRLAWYEDDVLKWLEAATPVGPPVKRRRGRPTKAEQLARAQSVEADRL